MLSEQNSGLLLTWFIKEGHDMRLDQLRGSHVLVSGHKRHVKLDDLRLVAKGCAKSVFMRADGGHDNVLPARSDFISERFVCNGTLEIRRYRVGGSCPGNEPRTDWNEDEPDRHNPRRISRPSMVLGTG
jgi:hypothetical protein